jgi:hypothetical protein
MATPPHPDTVRFWMATIGALMCLGVAASLVTYGDWPNAIVTALFALAYAWGSVAK